ncbi:MAG: DUF1743 domain-containing protein [Candidatus Njordarchaeota archaeon]
MSKCIFCGRETNGERICEYCREVICEICGKKLARGYCAVCGRLVCDDDSMFVGFARVCNDCISKDRNLSSYEYLKAFCLKESSRRENVVFDKIAEFGDIKEKNDNVFLFVGLDDFDSPYGMCTTYAGTLLVEELLKMHNVEFMDYPLLVRLDPNIPMKTRGNASIGLRMRIAANNVDNVKRFILEKLGKMSHFFFRKTQPAVVFYVAEQFVVDRYIYSVYSKALRTIVTRNESIRIVKNIRFGHLEIFTPSKIMSRGIVGALSAVGAVFEDYTFEILVYRRKDRISENRIIDAQSVFEMDRKLSPFVFDNVDANRIIIAPAGLDPVLMGIRGEFPEKLLEAFSIVRHEKHKSWCLFRTNQATGMHIRRIKKPSQARPYETVMLDMIVDRIEYEEDTTIIIGNADGWKIRVRIYRIQKGIREVISKLKKHDKIRIIMAVTDYNEGKLEGNFEEFFPLELSPIEIIRNPPCPICCARLKKKGKEEMYCKKCKYRIKKVFKVSLVLDRTFPKTKKRYIPMPRSHRHLTMPNMRIRIRAKKISGFFRPYMINIFCGKEKPDLGSIKIISYISDPKII